MEHQVMKGVRLQPSLIRRVERLTRLDGSSFSQFVRAAVIEKVNRLKKVAA